MISLSSSAMTSTLFNCIPSLKQYSAKCGEFVSTVYGPSVSTDGSIELSDPEEIETDLTA